MEGTIAPEVAVDAAVTGWAASLPSGRLVRVHPDVLSLPEPAQRWLAGHEMRHVMAHGWSEPGRWLGLVGVMVGVGAVGAGVRWSPLPPRWTLVAAVVGLGGVFLLWQVGTSWWSRRLEAEADRYADRGGRLEALDEPSLLELLIGAGDAPLWLSSHPRWRDRLPVPEDRLPVGIAGIEAELDQAVARLGAAARFRRRPPVLVMVRRLPGDRVALGRWQRVVVAKAALLTPADVLQPLLAAAVVQARRLPRVRATAAVSTAFLGLLAAAVAVVAPSERAVHTATALGAVLVFIAGYEVYRRAADRRLVRAAATR